jgi:hypothetical protein
MITSGTHSNPHNHYHRMMASHDKSYDAMDSDCYRFLFLSIDTYLNP